MGIIVVQQNWLDLSIEDLRNLVLIGSAVIGLPLVIWRSWLAHKQTRLSEAGQNIDRYRKGAAMLGDERLSVREAGIFGLHQLATAAPKEYIAGRTESVPHNSR